MKHKLKYLKLIVLAGLLVFLFAFSSHKNANRSVLNPIITFTGKGEPFVTTSTVSKLLIQNQQAVTNKPKETLDLNQLEAALNSNPMINSAQVFMHVDGDLRVEIEQKRPIARVETNESFYIDDKGNYMPLSTNYTARVPLITGNIKKENLSHVYSVAKKVNEDEFLKKNVVQIHQDDDNSLLLKLRNQDFVVDLGSTKHLEKKVNNLKAFYKKALKESLLNSYRRVNLKFDNQVVCTKK